MNISILGFHLAGCDSEDSSARHERRREDQACVERGRSLQRGVRRFTADGDGVVQPVAAHGGGADPASHGKRQHHQLRGPSSAHLRITAGTDALLLLRRLLLV